MSGSIKVSIIQKLFIGIIVGWTVLIILFLVSSFNIYDVSENESFSSNIELVGDN